MGAHVHWLWVGRRVAEGLHDQIGGKFQAGQLLDFVAGHGAGGVLGAHRGHSGFAVGAGPHAGLTARLADDFLGQGVAAAGFLGHLGFGEQRCGGESEGRTGLGGESTADDEVDAAAGPDLVRQGGGCQFETGQDGAVAADGPFLGVDRDHVAIFKAVHLALDGQHAGILGGVEVDGGDGSAHDHAAGALGRNVGDVAADMPEHGVDPGLAGGAGTHHVAHVGDGMALLFEFRDDLKGAGQAVHQHGLGVQRDVGSAPGLGGRREIVGVGLARHLEDRDGERFRHGGAGGEPGGFGPVFQDLPGMGIGLGLGHHLVEGIIDQQGVGKGGRRLLGQFGVGQQVDERGDVVAAHHGAQQLYGRLFVQKGRGGLALGQGGKKLRLHPGCFVHTRRHLVGDEVEQDRLFPGRRILEQCDQGGGLFGGKGQRRQPLGCAVGAMFSVGVKHLGFSLAMAGRASWQHPANFF